MPLLAALLFGCWQATAPLVDVPFEFVGRHVLIRVKRGEKTLRAVVDTGAEATMIDASFVPDAKGETLNARGIAASVAVRKVENVVLTIGDASLQTPATYAVPFKAALQGLDEFDAILGGDLFRHYVVEIDYPASRLRIYEPKGYVAPADGKPIPVRVLGGVPTVEGAIALPKQPERKVTVAIDTGGYGEIDVTCRMVLRERLEKVFRALPMKVVSYGLGGGVQGKTVPSATGRIGDVPFSGSANLIFSPDGAEGILSAYDVVLGGALLCRYNLVLDLTRSRLYLRAAER